MSFGGFGGFGEEESQEVATSMGKTPTRLPGTAGNQVGDRRVRNVPVSVRTALESALSAKDASDQPIIYEVAVKYIELFGQIESISYDASSLICTIDDGTGRITLKQYFGMTFEKSLHAFSLRATDSGEGAFVWAVGALRTGSDPYLSINQIKKISSGNEIAYHLLATCSAHIDIVEEKDGTFGATPLRSFGKMQIGGSTNLSHMETSNEVEATPQKSAPSTLSPNQIEELVYQFILTGKSTQWGFSKSDCVLKFKSQISEAQISKAIEQLLDDARIYDTGDEVHFKAIE